MTTDAVRLPALPADIVETRLALHRVAEEVVSPARVAATGNEIALEVTPGGFGTPTLPQGGRVRVEADELVVDEPGGAVRRASLSTTAAARSFAGLPEGSGDNRPLSVGRDSARALATFYSFADEILRVLRDEAPAGSEASPIRLWPEHFDVAFDQGEEAEGRRAGYGASPGDEQHPEPYLYVGPWAEPPPGPGWTATGFRGAELGYAALRDSADPRTLALEFFRGRRAALLDAPGR
jgi:hypothetical protein